MSNLWARLINQCSIFKQACVLCHHPQAEQGLCTPCRQQLPSLPTEHCQQCAQSLVGGGLCGACQKHRPAFDKLYAPYVFAYPLSGLIHAFKYGKQLNLAGALGALMKDFSLSKQQHYDLIIPVPLAKQRLAERGFNQSYELARVIAVTMAARFSDDWCWRKYNTPAQARLDRQERLKNVRNAFGVNYPCTGLRIALVDDVATSGATLNALAKILKQHGAQQVDAWVLARAFG